MKEHLIGKYLLLIAAAKTSRRSREVKGVDALYQVAFPILSIAEHRIVLGTNPGLNSLIRRMREISASHGLKDGEIWREGEGPEDWKRLAAEYARFSNEIFIETFNEFEEKALGQFYRYYREEFEDLFEKGQLRQLGGGSRFQH